MHFNYGKEINYLFIVPFVCSIRHSHEGETEFKLRTEHLVRELCSELSVTYLTFSAL